MLYDQSIQNDWVQSINYLILNSSVCKILALNKNEVHCIEHILVGEEVELAVPLA